MNKEIKEREGLRGTGRVEMKAGLNSITDFPGVPSYSYTNVSLLSGCSLHKLLTTFLQCPPIFSISLQTASNAKHEL